ncbi:PAS domain S-box protein [Candidatus Sumerlaeota bacterium]|nr:PAS domain S-box protein [Candidatus Sumerlaeota bacterium]
MTADRSLDAFYILVCLLGIVLLHWRGSRRIDLDSRFLLTWLFLVAALPGLSRFFVDSRFSDLLNSLESPADVLLPLLWAGLFYSLFQSIQQRDLRQSEASLRRVIDLLPHQIYAKDRHGRYVVANKCVADAYGTTVEALIGRSQADFHPSKEEERIFLEEDRRVIDLGPGSAEPLTSVRTLASSGRTYQFAKVPFEIPGSGEIVALGVSVDITNRIRAEKELRIKDYTISSLAAPLAVADLDGTITYVNQAFLDLWGYDSEEETVGHPAGEFAANPAEAARVIACLHERGWFVGEFDAQSKEGTSFDVHLSASMVTAENGESLCMVFSFIDVTERNQAFEALRRSEQMMRAVFENATHGLAVWNAERRLVKSNARFAEMLGYTVNELIDMSSRTFTHPDDVARQEPENRKIETGEKNSYAIEKRYVRRDGSPFWAELTVNAVRDARGKLEGTIAIIVDITERKRVEEERAESQRRLNTLVDNLPGFAYRRKNDSSWTMEYVSNGCLEVTGYSPEQIVDNREIAYNEIIVPEDRQRVWDEVQRAVEAGEPFILEYTIAWRSGRRRSVWEKGRGIFSDGGDLLALEGFITDVTDRVRAEEERRKFEAQFQHAQKLESLGILAGGIAHDFNNLLMGILGNADLAMDRTSALSPVRNYILEIEQSAKRAADLCRQMLAYSGKGKFLAQRINLNEIVDEMVHLLEVSISKKAVLKFNFAANLPAIEADPTQTRQVIMNLITNASEAIGDRSGVISINTGAMSCDPAYLTETHIAEDLAEGMYVYLEVSDTGCGMDKTTRERMFDPFFTTKFTGRGLGMAAVLGIVRGHKGTIKVYSEPQRGTTIKILLPAVDEPAESIEKEARTPADWKMDGTVLLVDDEETIRVVGKRMLERSGLKVLTASDGREAIDLYREHAGDVLCVILDLTMPHMDGEETFRELRRINPDVHVILSSGYNEQEIVGRFAGKGLAGFIQKPYRRQELISSIRQVLDS